ncbi:MAG: VOC family protein [Pseudomonadota bacterium]
MIGYATIGVKDVDAAKKWYCDLFADQGAEVKVDIGRLAMIGTQSGQPMIAVCNPYNGEAHEPGNGNMVAFAADSKEQAEALYNRAIEMGASCEGEAGQRIPDRFYGGYVRDPDGNKLCFYVFG